LTQIRKQNCVKTGQNAQNGGLCKIPAINSVEIEKSGRFWAVNVDGQMLAIVLYKRGALAVQDMVGGWVALWTLPRRQWCPPRTSPLRNPPAKSPEGSG